MGQAKQRGTKEERIKAAIRRDRILDEVSTFRRPSPKHLMTMITATAMSCQPYRKIK